jgi:uncharacterized RDD family membrane protein YckC
LAAVSGGQVILVVHGVAPGGISLLRLTEEGFEPGPSLGGFPAHERTPAGETMALVRDHLAIGVLDEHNELTVGFWSLADGSAVGSPEPVAALVPKVPSWTLTNLPFVAYGLLTVMLVVVLWYRRESLAVPAALPPGQAAASYPRRLTAFVVDVLITLPVWWVILAPAMPSPIEELPAPERDAALQEMLTSPSFLVRWLAAAGVFVVYCGVFEALLGATPGKRIVQCRVVDERGRRCRLRAVVLRNLIRIIELFPLFQLMPAIILILLTRNRQRLGDLVAATVVVEQAPLPGEPDARDSDDSTTR